MPKFGKTSLDRLATCDPRIVEIMTAVIEVYDVTILEGRRGWARQQALLDRDPPATTLEPGESKHNAPTREEESTWLSLAVDVAPYPIDWEDAKRFTYMAGLVIGIGAMLGYTIRWGGNWDMDQVILDDQNFDDLPHFEIVT